MGQYASPYLGMGNNPISMVDPDGGSTNDFYKNKTTGAVEWFDGSGAIDGYEHLGVAFSFTDAYNNVTAWGESRYGSIESWDQKGGLFHHNYNLNEVVVMGKSKVGGVGGNFDAEDGRKALFQIYTNYGVEMSTIVEKMYRIETSHFKSKQYRLTGTGGMEVHAQGPYYGWDSSFFKKYPEYTPVGTTGLYEGKGLSGVGGNSQLKTKPKTFVVMPSVIAGMMFKVHYINKYNGNYARWFSTDPAKQATYRSGLEGVRPRFTNSFKE